MKFLRNPKIRIWLTLGLSLFGLSVAGLSTFAWFQIETTKKTLDDNNTVKTVDPSIEIKNDGVMGYKIEPPIGANGFRDYSVTNVQSAAGSKVTVDNTNRAGEDTDFDIPTEGVGYYLVKKTPGGLYRYTYDDDGDGTKETYASKFQMYESTYDSTTTAYIPSLDIEEGQEIRIRSYNFSSNKTEHKQVRVYQVYGAGTTSSSINATTGDVTVPTGGKYRVWLDYTDENWDSDATTVQCRLGFEPVNITSEGANVRARANVPVKEAKTDFDANGKKATHIQFCEKHGGHTYSNTFTVLYIKSVSFASGYSHAYFRDFMTSFYGPERDWKTHTGGTPMPSKEGWSYMGNTDALKQQYLICSDHTTTSYSGSAGIKHFYFPEWVTALQVKAVGNQYYNWYAANGASGENDYISIHSDWGYGESVYIDIQTYDSWTTSVNNGDGVDYSHNWGSTTISLYAVNSQTKTTIGATALAGTLALEKYYLLAPADVTAAKNTTVTSGGNSYEFHAGSSWYKTYTQGSALSSSFSTSLMTGSTLSLYAYYDQVYAVNFFASFFIIDKDGTYRQVADSIPSESLGSTTSVAGETYNAPNSGYSDLIYKSDNTNGIYYRFARDTDSGNWFTDEDCDSSTHVYSPSTTTGNRALYAKYVADVRETSSTHKTFYVDLRKCYTNNRGNTWNGVKTWDTTNGRAAATAVKVAPLLYRITLPVNIGFQIYNSSQEYGTGSETEDMYAVAQSSGTLASYENGKTILFIYNCDYRQNHTVKWDSLVSPTTTGTAVVEYYTTRWETLVEMHLGDQNDTNAFVYEHGYSVPLGTKIRISVTGGTYAGTYGKASDYATSLPFFLTQSGGGFVTQGYVGSAKFNFYLTTGSKVSMAMVPDLGNGYYIMNSKRASWNDAETAFKMSQYTTGMPADCTNQFKGVITFSAGDRFKIRSSDWLDVAYETDTGAFASGALTVSNDANKDVNVVTGGKYVIYFKNS